MAQLMHFRGNVKMRTDHMICRLVHRSKVGWGGQLAAHKRRVAADMHPSTV